VKEKGISINLKYIKMGLVMNMKLMVYPSSFEACLFLRHAKLMNKYDAVYLAGPTGWMFPSYSMDAKNGGEAYHSVSSFEEILPLCDDVLFLDTMPSPSIENLVEKIGAAVNAGKTVYVDNGEKFSGVTLPKGKVERICADKEFDGFRIQQDIVPIFEIPIPVIFVLGVGPNAGKFELQLALREGFLNHSYSLSQIGSKRISQFWGFNSFPDWINSNQYSIHDKIIMLNRYFYQRYLEEKPDVMIIGIPGGIIPMNPLVFEDMGETAFMVANAIRPDAAVLGIYAHRYNQTYFDELRALCKYRFNLDLKYIAVSNMDITVSPETHTSEFMPISLETVENEFLATKDEFQGLRLFNLYKKDDMAMLVDRMLEDLRNNL